MFDFQSHLLRLSETQPVSRHLVEQAGCQFGGPVPGIHLAGNDVLDLIENRVGAA